MVTSDHVLEHTYRAQQKPLRYGQYKTHHYMKHDSLYTGSNFLIAVCP